LSQKNRQSFVFTVLFTAIFTTDYDKSRQIMSEQLKDTTTEVQNYADILPRGAVSRIAEEINKSLAQLVSVRTVERVVKGLSPDSYGILPIAARIAKEHQEAIKTLNEIKQAV
jgi:hypothetical protein